jgi:hypothetical protein
MEPLGRPAQEGSDHGLGGLASREFVQVCLDRGGSALVVGHWT